MRDLTVKSTRKTWTQPQIKVVELNAARGGSTGTSDHTPGGRS
jgi:hypothetical protein